jgi:hypothetical protein
MLLIGVLGASLAGGPEVGRVEASSHPMLPLAAGAPLALTPALDGATSVWGANVAASVGGGASLAVWDAADRVMAQRLDSAGRPLGPPIAVSTNLPESSGVGFANNGSPGASVAYSASSDSWIIAFAEAYCAGGSRCTERLFTVQVTANGQLARPPAALPASDEPVGVANGALDLACDSEGCVLAWNRASMRTLVAAPLDSSGFPAGPPELASQDVGIPGVGTSQSIVVTSHGYLVIGSASQVAGARRYREVAVARLGVHGAPIGKANLLGRFPGPLIQTSLTPGPPTLCAYDGGRQVLASWVGPTSQLTNASGGARYTRAYASNLLTTTTPPDRRAVMPGAAYGPVVSATAQHECVVFTRGAGAVEASAYDADGTLVERAVVLRASRANSSSDDPVGAVFSGARGFLLVLNDQSGAILSYPLHAQ